MDKTKNISFSIEYAQVVQNDDTFSVVELDLLHLGKNRNGSAFSKEGVEKSLASIQNKPIICIYDCNVRSCASDYTSHATNDEECDNIVCIGTIPMSDFSKPEWVTTEDGFERLRVRGLIWSFYNYTAIDILQNQNDEAKISIEVEPLSTHKADDGTLVIDEFNFLGVSLLSNSVMEGMAGSKMKVLKYSYEETVAKTHEYLAHFSQNESAGQNIFDKINSRKGGTKVKLGHKELEAKLWADLSCQMYVCESTSYHKYYLEEIYDTHIVAYDNETNEYVKFKYDIDEDGVAKIDYATRKFIDAEKPFKTYAKEDVATGDELKIDKTTLSDDAWGGIDKGDLKDKVIKAKNFKTIAKDVFLDLREGWEDGEVTKLKYPVMQIKDGTLVYNRGALASAKAYAEKNNETEVLEKLKKIYKRFKLDFDAEDISSIMFEISASAYEEIDKSLDNSNDVDNFATTGQEPQPESKDVEQSNFEDINRDSQGDTPKVNEKKPETITTMSADENVDAAAQEEMLNKEAENNKNLADEAQMAAKEEKSKDVVIAELNAKITAYETELAELRKFKTNTEEQQKLFKIEQVFAEVRDSISQEDVDSFKEEAKKFTLENIDLWANTVKAKAFEATMKNKDNSNIKFARVDLWTQHQTSTSNTTSDGLWKIKN